MDETTGAGLSMRSPVTRAEIWAAIASGADESAEVDAAPSWQPVDPEQFADFWPADSVSRRCAVTASSLVDVSY